MSDEKRVVIISGSPKPPDTAASDFLAARAAQAMREGGVQADVLNVRRTLNQKTEEEAFAAMAEADAMIFIFPLYVFCLPGLLMRFLQDYKAYADAHPQARWDVRVYAVVNCGFPEPEINEQAVEVIGRFAAAVGARFGFGVMIGSGGMMTVNVAPAQKMVRQFSDIMRRIAAEVAAGAAAPAETLCLRIGFPRRLYFMMGNRGWRQQIRRNGKRVKDLYARPYLRTEE